MPPQSIELHLKLTCHFVLSFKFIDRGAALMFPIAPVACLGLPLGFAGAARAEPPLAEIVLPKSALPKQPLPPRRRLRKNALLRLATLLPSYFDGRLHQLLLGLADTASEVKRSLSCHLVSFVVRDISVVQDTRMPKACRPKGRVQDFA